MARAQREHVTASAFGLSIRRSERLVAMRDPHRHDEVEANFLESGELTYLIGGRLVRLPAGRFAFFWAAVPHRLIEASDAARGFWFVTVPLAWVLSWELPPKLLGQMLDGELLCDAAPHAADAARLAEWQEALDGRDRRRDRPAVLELEARFRRFALDQPDGQATRAPVAHGHSRVERLARFIVEHYREPIALADIAAAAGLHPNYAANLFRRRCGQTLLQCLTQHRLAHAQRLLATTDAKVIDVALESGFGSLSRFYEAFARARQETPAAYRARFAG